jgi:peptidoglycan biosynthesis protein MviN/MurJ (putative lipid II flippase)
VSKRTDSPGLGSIASGALTAGSFLVVSAIAAAIGVVIAREFGLSAETDGLLAAYGLFVVIVIAAQAIRVAVLPELALARDEGRLAGELAGFAVALVVIAIPLLLVAAFGSSLVARLLTGDGSEIAQETATEVLRWVVPAGVLHLFAGVAASGLAALDDYRIAALGYALGSSAGLALILARIEPDGIIAVAWGSMLNGVVTLAIVLSGLVLHAARLGMPRRAVLPSGPPVRTRLGAFAVGAALPLALQLLYVVCLPFASRLGTGAATSFVYAYLAASSLVTVTAGSLGIVTSVPLSRAGLAPAQAVRHVVATSWLSLALAGAAAGVFALAGGDLVEAVLGEAYAGDVGADIGRLIVVLSPWMIAAVGVAVTFPLAFVAGRTRGLPWIALGALALQVPLAWAGGELLELDGLALALAASTLLVLAALLVELHALGGTVRRLGAAAAFVAGLTVVTFVPPALLLGSLASVLVGLVLYVVLLAVARPRSLRDSWHYLRALG